MKRTILSLLFLVPVLCFAQNWETVQPTTKAEKTTQKTETKKLTKAEKEAQKYEEEKPYLAGAVPEIDGQVVYSINLDVPGKSAQEIYDRTYQFLDQLAQGDGSFEDSKILLVDKDSKSIVAQCKEWMVFTKKLLELDQALFSYVVEANCQDGKLNVKISRLRYAYELDRSSGFNTHAEDLITDKLMLTKDGRSLNKKNAKFRRKTVDRMSEIAASLRAEMGK